MLELTEDIAQDTGHLKHVDQAFVGRRERYIVDTTGQRIGVILSLKRYQELMDDLCDLAVVAERRSEQSISLEEMKRRLKDHGIL